MNQTKNVRPNLWEQFVQMVFEYKHEHPSQ
jgi:hypothetical protein